MHHHLDALPSPEVRLIRSKRYLGSAVVLNRRRHNNIWCTVVCAWLYIVGSKVGWNYWIVQYDMNEWLKICTLICKHRHTIYMLKWKMSKKYIDDKQFTRVNNQQIEQQLWKWNPSPITKVLISCIWIDDEQKTSRPALPDDGPDDRTSLRLTLDILQWSFDLKFRL